MAFGNGRTHILSTEGMINFARQSPKERFLVATETGIIHRLSKEAPEKRFEAVSEKAICRYMKMITLEKLRDSLRDWKHVVTVPEDVAARARGAIDRMVAIIVSDLELSAVEREFLENPFVGIVTDAAPRRLAAVDGRLGRRRRRGRLDQHRVRAREAAQPRSATARLARRRRSRRSVPLGQDQRDGDARRRGRRRPDRPASKKYTGRDVYASRQPGEKRVTVRITPTRIQSRGLDVE